MINKSRRSNFVIAIILFVIAAAFLIYGIYMLCYSIDYIEEYKEISTISPESSFQYVVSSSATYFGFAAVIFAGGMLLLSSRKSYSEALPNDDMPQDVEVEIDADADAHPENNPYYTAPADAVHTDEAARPDAGIAEIPAQPETDIPDIPRQSGPDTHENQIWQEAELHQVAAFEEHAGPSHHEDLPHDTEPELTEAFQQDAATAHTEESPQQDAIPTEAETTQQDAAPADHEYHIRPELASDSWLKDAFIKK